MRGSLPILFWLAYALTIAGVNLINPLLPTLRNELDLGFAGLAAMYSTYLFVLVGALSLVSWRSPPGQPFWHLLCGLGLALVGDILHALGTIVSTVLGRAFYALAVGVATNAVARLMLQVAGERGRTTTATANIPGALTGTAFASTLVATLKEPTGPAFLVHSGALALLMATLIIIAWRGVDPITGAPVRAAASPVTTTPFFRGAAIGGLAWMSAGVTIVLAPSFYGRSGDPLGASVTAIVLAVFGAGAISQHVLGQALHHLPTCLCAQVLGLASLAAACAGGEFALLAVGAVLVGTGYGGALRLGLRIVTVGLDERQQGTRASFYACFSYAVAAVSLVSTGWLADVVGGPSTLLAVTVICGAIAIVLTLTEPSRARSTAQPGPHHTRHG